MLFSSKNHQEAQSRAILIQDPTSVNKLSFPKHDESARGMMVSHLQEKTDEKMQEAEPELDRIAWLVQNLFRYTNFYDQISPSLSQSLS